MLEPILESKRQALLDKVSLTKLMFFWDCIIAILSSCLCSYVFFFQYELLTQMKSTFEKKLQRQHELSEVFIFCIVSVLANLAKSRVLQSVSQKTFICVPPWFS